MQSQSNLRAILCLVVGIAIFSVQDLILKLLSGSYPLHEAMMLRSVTAIPFMLAITKWFDGSLASLASRSWPAMLARGLLNFLAYAAYYLALAALPMATTVALYFTAPLIIVVLSVVMLHETVSLKRWLAVGMGFAGVLILVHPGGGLFDWAALLPIFCGFAYALSMIMARTMGTRDSAAAMAFWGNIAFLLCSLALSLIYGPGSRTEAFHPSLAFLTRGWAMPTALDAFLMCSCGLIAAVGLTLLTQAYRIGLSSVVAPFEFTFAFWGILWGWLFWHQLPDGAGWLGIAVIIAAGIYVMRADKAQPAPPEPAPLEPLSSGPTPA
ncbi:MAG: DMT family transporter [Cypionkella sp.]